MKCEACRRTLETTDRRRRYCSEECRLSKRSSRRKRRHLHAVDPAGAVDVDDAPDTAPNAADTARAMSVATAAREGSDLEFLMAIRDRLADQVSDPNCPPRELASLTKRLEENRKQIRAERDRLAEEAADAADAPDEEWDDEAI